MEKWEYKTTYLGGHELPEYKIGNYLNDQGQDGWELVTILIKKMLHDPSTVAVYNFIFKRKIKK